MVERYNASSIMWSVDGLPIHPKPNGEWVRYSDYAALEAQHAEARSLVAEANNSLYGSHSYFHSTNGGEFDKYHLARPIEELKDRSRRLSTLEATPPAQDEQAVYTDPDGKVWHPHRGYWCWKVSSELAQAQERIKELEAQLAERVKVKPLEWCDKSGSEYEVRWDGIGIGAHYVARAVKCGDLILCCGKYHTDINKAKAAAQADYERCILSALEATPPAPKVTEEMVEAASREYMRIFGKHLLSEHARLILTAAQEAGKP